MDNDELVPGRVDQLFAGYSSSGMGALESSFGDPELHRRWEQTLIHYVRLDPFGRDDPPSSAFTYITFDNGSAAILRRVRAGDSIGRNNAHALIGSADLLGAVALDLTRWDKWMSDREPTALLQPLFNQDLRVAPNAADSLDDAANDCAEFAVPLMGYALSQPRVSLSSIAMDQERIVPTLRLFERVLKPLFSVEKRIRSWSFSTYEVSDADHGNLRRPELIFLPKLPDHAAEIRHQRVFFDETTQVEGQYQHLAQHLIAEYLRLGCEEYAVAMGGAVGSMPNIESRIRYLLSSGLAPPQYVPESAYAAQPTPAPQPGGAQKAESPWTQAVGGHSPYRHQPVGAPAALRPRPEPRPVVPSRNVPDDEEIVRQLANAQDEKGIDYWLAALCERSTYAPVTDRWGLICRYGILELLPRHLYLWDLIVAYGHVLEFAFGASAKALHEQSYFALVEKRIKHPKVSPLFGCMVYYFVRDSRMGPHCTKLLHERLGRLTSISLVPEVMDKLNSRSVTAGRGERLVALFRNSQVRILLILLLLVSIAIVSMIIMV